MGETRGGESFKANVTVACGVNDKHGKRVPRVSWLKITGILVGCVEESQYGVRTLTRALRHPGNFRLRLTNIWLRFVRDLHVAMI